MKRVKQRRRGKGKPVYRARSHRFKAEVNYKNYLDSEKSSSERGLIIDFIDDPARNCPLMLVKFKDSVSKLPAPLGLRVGDYIEQGASSKINPGNILPLVNIPEGTNIFNIERIPGDGGKMVRSAGESAKLISKDEKGIIIQLPSRKFKLFNPLCRASIGTIAGGGHKDKPFVKASKRKWAFRAKTGKWPKVRGTAMNPVDHPHGGGKGRGRKSLTVSRGAPPGAKVGSIAPRRTGRRSR